MGRGELYQFRFNTWGVTGVWNESHGEFERKNGAKEMSVGAYPNNLLAYPKTTPQKAGKTAYASLANFASVKKFLAEKRAANPGGLINVVEIGSGTGAGANELSWLHEDFNYTAIHATPRDRYVQKVPPGQPSRCAHAQTGRETQAGRGIRGDNRIRQQTDMCAG